MMAVSWSLLTYKPEKAYFSNKNEKEVFETSLCQL